MNERYEGDANRVDGMRYLLTRAGFADCRISTAFIGKLASELQAKARESLHDRERLKMIQHEVSILAAIYNFKSDRDTLKNSDRAKARNNALDSSVRDVLTKNRQNVPKSRLYAGV